MTTHHRLHRRLSPSIRFVLLAAAICAAACGGAGGGGGVVGCTSTAPAPSASSPVPALTPADVPVIPRRLLFGNPDKTGPTLSDDGTQLAFRAAVDGVMNVWVAPSDKPEAARPVTKDTSRGIRQYFWAYTNAHIIYLQDKGGDENWRVWRRTDAGTFEPWCGITSTIGHRTKRSSCSRIGRPWSRPSLRACIPARSKRATV